MRNCDRTTHHGDFSSDTSPRRPMMEQDVKMSAIGFSRSMVRIWLRTLAVIGMCIEETRKHDRNLSSQCLARCRLYISSCRCMPEMHTKFHSPVTLCSSQKNRSLCSLRWCTSVAVTYQHSIVSVVFAVLVNIHELIQACKLPHADCRPAQQIVQACAESGCGVPSMARHLPMVHCIRPTAEFHV